MPTPNQTEMPIRTLGRNGPTVSLHGLGAMTFGDETSEAEAHNMLDLFVERGGTFIDTADIYAEGVSEQIIGRWGKNRGYLDDVIIATKCRFSPTPGSRGGARRAVIKRAEASLKRLATDAIDLYFIHGWDHQTDVAETLGALGDLRAQGKIHHYGWSNVTGWQLERICQTAKAMGLPVPCALQPQYSLLDRGIETEVLPCAIENEIGLTPWSPLGGGWLTGKYRFDEMPMGATRLGENPNRGVEAYNNRNNEHTKAVLQVLGEVADQLGRQMSHVALAWLASRPMVSSILLGARNAQQLSNNLDAMNLVLDEETLSKLSSVSAIGLPEYPYGFVREWSGVEHWDRMGT